jgi:hypothetical protein
VSALERMAIDTSALRQFLLPQGQAPGADQAHTLMTKGTVGSIPTPATVSGQAGHWRAQGAVNAPHRLWRFNSVPAHQPRM